VTGVPLDDEPLDELLDEPLDDDPLDDEPLDDEPLDDEPLDDEPLDDEPLDELLLPPPEPAAGPLPPDPPAQARGARQSIADSRRLNFMCAPNPVKKVTGETLTLAKGGKPIGCV
jgi:hypothetical protein